MMYEQPYQTTSYRGQRIEISTILSFHTRPMMQWAVHARVGGQPVYAFHVNLGVAMGHVRACIDAAREKKKHT